MSKLTITEALAELKTIGKRLDKKRDFVVQYLMRPEQVRDPLEKEGGTSRAIGEERQGIRDLQNRIIALRRAIQLANEANTISIAGDTRSIADWLVWRREVAPWHQQMLALLRSKIDSVRNETLRRGAAIAAPGTDTKAGDVIVNISEQELAREIERLEETLGTLDGQLSLKNATVLIEA